MIVNPTCKSKDGYLIRLVIMRVSTKGQVTIPLDIREQLGLLPHTEVAMVIKENKVIIEKKLDTLTRGKYVLNRMKGKASVKMSTDEIMNITRS
jgi:AbrB family looped-hinge helix DNA binding protein